MTMFKTGFLAFGLFAASTLAGNTNNFDTSDFDTLTKSLERLKSKQDHISKSLWDFAELSFEENKSSTLLQKELKKEGFKVTPGVAGLKTAFTASYGTGTPVIAILAEFDALPGISQAAKPLQTGISGKDTAHACGHNLFASGSFGAAVAVKDWLKKTGFKGTIRLYGTPAEEKGDGKTHFIKAGLFDDVDIALHWHPEHFNSANAFRSMAIMGVKFRFEGISAHASSAPDAGRSALDGVESLNYMVNMMREHVPSDTRIHYVITDGGKAPNVVPNTAEAFYFIRQPDTKKLLAIWQRVKAAAEGAAMGTGTKLHIQQTGGLYSILPNVTLARVMDKNLRKVGILDYSDAEMKYAREIAKSFEHAPNIDTAAEIRPFNPNPGLHPISTDVGDVSWNVPTVGLDIAAWVPGTPGHSWQSAATSGTSIGFRGARTAARVLALSAIEIFQNEDLRKEARKEFDQRRGTNFKFKALDAY